MKNILIAVFFVLIMNSAQAFDCKYSRPIDRWVDLKELGSLKADADAGSLVIIRSNRKDLRIKAKLYSNNQEALALMGIESTLKAE